MLRETSPYSSGIMLPLPGKALFLHAHFNDEFTAGMAQEIALRQDDAQSHLCEPQVRRSLGATFDYLAGEPHLLACVKDLGNLVAKQGLTTVTGDIRDDKQFAEHTDAFRSMTFITIVDGVITYELEDTILQAKAGDVLCLNNRVIWPRRPKHRGSGATGRRLVTHFQK